MLRQPASKLCSERRLPPHSVRPNSPNAAGCTEESQTATGPRRARAPQIHRYYTPIALFQSTPPRHNRKAGSFLFLPDTHSATAILAMELAELNSSPKSGNAGEDYLLPSFLRGSQKSARAKNPASTSAPESDPPRCARLFRSRPRSCWKGSDRGEEKNTSHGRSPAHFQPPAGLCRSSPHGHKGHPASMRQNRFRKQKWIRTADCEPHPRVGCQDTDNTRDHISAAGRWKRLRPHLATGVVSDAGKPGPILW